MEGVPVFPSNRAPDSLWRTSGCSHGQLESRASTEHPNAISLEEDSVRGCKSAPTVRRTTTDAKPRTADGRQCTQPPETGAGVNIGGPFGPTGAYVWVSHDSPASISASLLQPTRPGPREPALLRHACSLRSLRRILPWSASPWLHDGLDASGSTVCACRKLAPVQRVEWGWEEETEEEKSKELSENM